MSGVSSAIDRQTLASFMAILVEKEVYSIDWLKFRREVEDERLLALTDRILDSFRKLTIAGCRSLDIDRRLCDEQLCRLAEWGQMAYRMFFNDDARKHLATRFPTMGAEIPAPTFISKEVPFPWELLYEGEDYNTARAEMFWGLRYSPARILDPAKGLTAEFLTQSLPSDMLFCLHHKLRQAHEREWPEVRKLVMAAREDCFHLLGSDGKTRHVACGATLRDYLYQSSHNMVHFACHCRPGEAGADVLVLSSIGDDGIQRSTPLLEISNYTLIRTDGRLQRRPLIFLNACQSGGGGDVLRKTFHFPRVFIERGAAAVVATACPVPDLFAAAFARHFYSLFLRGQEIAAEAAGEKIWRPMTIGEALRATRWHFLERHNNPLGLAYGLYSPAQYKLERSLTGGGL